VIGRSYGGETAIELALRHPGRVRALVLLEAASLSLDEQAMAWAEELRAAVEEAAARDVSSVAETFLRRVLGDAQWESFPDPLRQMFVENSRDPRRVPRPVARENRRGPSPDRRPDAARGG